MTAKRKNISEIRNYDLSFTKIPDHDGYNTYCYDLVPLMLLENDKAENILIIFYKNKKNSFVNEKEGNELLQKLGVKLKSTYQN
jgi:hypothetical protein